MEQNENKVIYLDDNPKWINRKCQILYDQTSARMAEVRRQHQIDLIALRRRQDRIDAVGYVLWVVGLGITAFVMGWLILGGV